MDYDSFIRNIIETRGRFGIPEMEYKEKHHIVPRCMGGSESVDNKIDLYAREHLIAHKLLVEKYPNNRKLIFAYHTMAFCKNGNVHRNYELTPDEYEELRLLFVTVMKTRTVSESTKIKVGESIRNNKERSKKISLAMKGNKNGAGRKLSDETKRKISNANKGKVRSEETRQKLREIHLGNSTRKGCRHTCESIEKMRLASTGSNNAGFGKHWYTNGVKNIRLSDGENIPAGFVRGKSRKLLSVAERIEEE